ncbi:MAG: DNA polymerase III subunit gamma/tau [Clostridia bacterium]|nr:DNA polymerase III subunit gamma/tau [Clostridia bacterium]
MHQAFYRKYRPKVFSEVVGRDEITTVLRGQVKTGKVSHAYLFCGMRGSGKTTCAKILAKAVNCLSPVNGDPCGQCEACRAIDSGLTLDIVEMDAASNNGVGDVRDMIEQITYTPSELKTRVYIIDEVHMLTPAAFNALLKTLEEPPSHVMFILATTEVHKLPATIVSRCQRFDFDRISNSDIVSRLRYVADCEKIECDDDALYVMAKLASGALRDALGYLELCAASGRRLDEKTVSSLLGTSSYDTLISIVDAVSSKNVAAAFTLLDDAYKRVNDISVLWFELVSVYRDILVLKATGSASYADATPSQAAALSSVSGRFNREKLMFTIRTLEDAIYLMQRSPSQKRIIADMCIVKLCDERLDTSNEALASRIASLEDSITLMGSGVRPAEPQPAPAAKTANAEEPKKPAPAAAEEKTELRVSLRFPDIASKLKSADASSASWLTFASGFEGSDGTYRILFKNGFSLSLAQSAKNAIDSAVISVTGKYSPQTILLELQDKNSDYTLIDDVIEALQDQQ